MLTGIIVFGSLAGALSVLLVVAGRLLARGEDGIADRIEALLPRIQCGQCGYPGCRPYAEAIAAGQAAINLCPPGGEQAVKRLADLLGIDPAPVDTTHGSASLSQIARIDEMLCIGCNLCQQACPIDAIVGTAQMMHTVLSEHCTGCELCIPPCPASCIDMVARHA